MTLDLPISESRLTNAARLIHQSMWLLFIISAGLTIMVRRSVPARTGSIWLLGCALLALGLSFALRNVVRRVGHRNTEDSIVRDVKTFLERQAVPPVVQAVPANAAVKQTTSPAGDPCVPSRLADFVALKGAGVCRTPPADPVVFDASPSRVPVAVRMDFHAV